MKRYIDSYSGYTLIEIVIVMIIMGIMAAVAMQSLDGVGENARFEETRDEMDHLASAITGNADLISGGIRTDYGYVGDIGALPSSWNDLVTDPGYANWNGPYIVDNFSGAGTNTEFKNDAWGTEYSTPNTSSFSSTGGDETLTRNLAGSVDDIIYNSVSASVVDLDFSPPGATYADSVILLLTFPNGSGSYSTRVLNPNAGGYASFDSIPIGIHTLKVAYLPTSDTLVRKVNIDPGSDYYADIQFSENYWTDSSTGGGGGGATTCSAGDWKFPSAEGDDYNQWSNGNRTYSDNGQYARESSNGDQNDWYDFNFGISSGATICGIEITVEARSQTSWSTGGVDIELSWNGGSNYTSSSNSLSWTGNSWQVKIAGGPTETWGRTWAGSDFSNGNFMIRMEKTGTNGRDLRVDYIKIRVYYYE